MSNYAICSEGLTKIYSKRAAVDHVNIHVPDGSIYGFVGENGSGKTTIIRLLMGLIRPNEGRYSLYDTDFKDKNIYQIRANVSAIVEAPSLVPSMNAYQNLKYACMYYGITATEELVNKALSDVGLHDVGKKKVKNFSLGMRQRLGIAMALMNKPKLMLLDEPMNGLDPEGIAELRDLLIELNQKQGLTVLISSHILSELEKIASVYGFISHGRIVEEISVEELLAKCEKALVIKVENVAEAEEAVKELKIKKYKTFPNGDVYIYDDVNIGETVAFLNKKKINILSINSVDESVEEYYLKLINKGAN